MADATNSYTVQLQCMCFPVAVFVAEIVIMRNIKEPALLAACTYTSTISLWLCYVDNTFAAVNKKVV